MLALTNGVLNHEIGSWVERFGGMIADLEALKPFIEPRR